MCRPAPGHSRFKVEYPGEVCGNCWRNGCSSDTPNLWGRRFEPLAGCCAFRLCPWARHFTYSTFVSPPRSTVWVGTWWVQIPMPWLAAATMEYSPRELRMCSIGVWSNEIICSAMWKHLNQHNLISEQQSGFRSGHSISDALTYMTQRLINSINNKEEARLVCLDISRAFDRVWHPGLLAKLAANGFSAGTLLKWLTDYLENRSFRVVLNGKTSSVKQINAGVPQGSILGPLLFLIFINDINENLTRPLTLLCYMQTMSH